jgi:general nucleoside transport system permease protein
MMDAWSGFMALAGNAAAMTSPILFAATGALLTELSGTLNIALEGLITVGAFFSVAAAAATGSLILGMLLGALAATALAAAYGGVALKLRANEFVAGLAANLFAAGLVAALSQRLFGTKAVVPFDIPALPALGPSTLEGPAAVLRLVLGHDAMVYLSWAFVALTWVLVARTPFGLRLKAAGSNPLALLAVGIKPLRPRFLAILFSGLACGLAGASLSLPLAAYVPGMSAGRGWIALVAVYLGGRKPLGILLACFLFAFAQSLSDAAQGFLEIPSDFILAFPYAITLVALAAGGAARKLRKG